LKIRLLTVGKPKEREMAALHDGYARRIGQLGIKYESASVLEVKAGDRYSDRHVMERESRLLTEYLAGKEKSSIIALDRQGELFGSVALAGRLESWATPHATFVIGGPLGLHAAFLSAADCRWSLSPLTFPHELARLLLAEQLYRAASILRGLPYHK
jgi:23S rRNA (pseudouridine1915-N3)-methyltransferase